MRRIDYTNFLGLFFSLFLLMPVPAHAYFDLSTGNYIIQVLLAFGAAGWFSIRGALKSLSLKKNAAPSSTATVDDTKDESSQ